MDLISVVIPAFNAERWLGAAIDSVLAQNWPDIEIIVIDNASGDGTSGVALSFGPPVSCHPCPSPGQPIATNLGIRLSRGEWLAFVDADDLWAPDKIARQMRLFEQDPGLEAAFGNALNFSGEYPTNPEAAGVAATLHGTLLIRRDAFLRVGFFDERYTIGSVIDWYLRAQEAGLRMTTLPETLLYRRIHDDNLGTREKRRQTDYAFILKAALDRRRKAGGSTR